VGGWLAGCTAFEGGFEQVLFHHGLSFCLPAALHICCLKEGYRLHVIGLHVVWQSSADPADGCVVCSTTRMCVVCLQAGFAASGHPAVRAELDLVEDEDQITHEMSLEDKHDPRVRMHALQHNRPV
jgi:hypothetical protein